MNSPNSKDDEIRPESLQEGPSVVIPPAPLYIYLPAFAALEDLSHQHLKLSNARAVNDPFEYAWKMDYPISDDEKNRIIVEYKLEYAEKMSFISFSPLCDNGLMWAYYTEKHTGMCLGLDFSNWTGKETVTFEQVEYNGPCLIKNEPRTTEQNLTLIRNLFRSKQSIWAHEKEWRALVPKDDPKVETNSDGVPFLRIPPTFFDSIIFGSRCSLENMGRAMLLCIKNGINPSFSRIAVDYAKSRLEVVSVSEKTRDECMTLALLKGFS